MAELGGPQSGHPTGLANGPRWRGVRQQLVYLALGLLSGALAAVPFLDPLLWWVAYLALVPWVFLLTRETARWGWLQFLAGACVFFAIALSPFALFHQTVPYALALFYGPFLLPFAILLRRIYRRFELPLTLLVPMVWVATEWLRLRFSIGQVAIFPLGTSQFERHALIQISDLTGVAGVSFTVATASGAIADLVVGRRYAGWRRMVPASAFFILLGLVLAYGRYRGESGEVVDGPRLALVQPNVTHYKDPARAKSEFEEQIRFTRAEIAPGSADLVVLPENAVSVPIGDDPSYGEELGELAREQGAHLVVGAFTRASLVPPRVYTSAYYLSDEGDFLARYHKLHLIPWAEYIPFESWLPRLSPALSRSHEALTRRLLGYLSHGVPGAAITLFPLESVGRTLLFAVPICFEVSSSEFGREAAALGADFLLNITSEGVFGAPIYRHMLAHATFRAVENRTAVVRVGNNGISGIIEPGGRIRSLVEGKLTGKLYLEPGTLVDRVPVRPERGGTFYTRHGDLFAYLCLAGSLGLFAASFLVRRRPSESRAAGM